MKWHKRPHVFVTDKLRSYEAALNELGVANPLETGRWLNNKAENSHLPFQRRERAMLGFRRMRSLRKFASVHSSVHNHFNQDHHLYSRENFKLNRRATVAEWRKLLFRKSSRILRETETGYERSHTTRRLHGTYNFARRLKILDGLTLSENI